jgi:hypothetical protein
VDKAALEQEGLELARERRRALAALIQSDPERALALTVPVSVRQALPASVTGLLEERVSGSGSLAVLVTDLEAGNEAETCEVVRTATIRGREYKVFVFGRRLDEPTRLDLPVHGIAVDDLLAVSDNPMRVLEPEEAAEARAKRPGALCPVCSGLSTSRNEEVLAEVAGEISFFCGPEHAEALNSQLIAEEAGARALGRVGTKSGPSSWTLGQKRLLFIRVDFEDLAGAPFSDNTGTALISNLNVFYTQMSYGLAGFAVQGAGSEVTPTLRMPQTAAWYGTNGYITRLRLDALAAASGAGYDTNLFDLDVVCFGLVPGLNWNGMASIGTAGAWLRNNFTLGVAAHELGHNFGLRHANFWNTSGKSVIGPGTSVEYGDSFDNMGDGRNLGSRYHFNARYKSYLDWLTVDDTVTVTTNGTYRIYAQDDPLARGVRGLKVPVDGFPPFPMATVGPYNYWIEFRQAITANRWLMNGAGLRWAWNANQSSLLLDTTPGSSEGKNDSPLVIGRTFSDSWAGIHITAVGKGGTSPESLDVVVNLGSFPSNVPPTLSLLAAATNTQAGAALSFEAAASDPDGDALAYYWDFGDGTFGTNGAAASHSWSTHGEYVVRCRVADMKGGNGSACAIVVVGVADTYRISGRVTLGDQPLENVRLSVTSTQMSYTDSDGRYTLVGLAASNYTVNASLDGYTLTQAGFTNPVSVGPSAEGVDFLAAATLYPPYVVTPPGGQVAPAGEDITFNVVASGTAPLGYQWRWNGTNIAGATGTSHTLTNAQPSEQGGYTVVVSNVAGMATSAVAWLIVQLPPTIVTQPISQTVNLGSNATFSVTASGPVGAAGGFLYQWYFNDTNLIASATRSNLTIVAVRESDAGTYRVVVNNGAKTTSSNAVLTVNHLPVPGSYLFERLPWSGLDVRKTDVLGSDADGDALVVWSVDSPSAQGGSVTTNAEWILYTPPAGFTNSDTFTYTVSDGRGGFGQGTINVEVRNDPGPPPAPTIENLGDGSFRLRFYGIPGGIYTLEWADNLEHPGWQILNSATADPVGLLEYLDAPPAGSTNRFYRLAAP